MDASLEQFMRLYNLTTRDEITMSKYRVWLKCVNDETTIRNHIEKLERQIAQFNQKKADNLLTALRFGLPIDNIYTLGRQFGLPDEKIDRVKRGFES